MTGKPQWPQPAGRGGRSLVPVNESPAAVAAQHEAAAQQLAQQAMNELIDAGAQLAAMAHEVGGLKASLPAGLWQEAEKMGREVEGHVATMRGIIAERAKRA